MPRPLVVKVTCGADDPERANQAVTVAATAVAAGAEVSLWLAGEATWFAVRDRRTTRGAGGGDLALEHAPPVADLVDAVLAGGRVVLCTQCAARRGIEAADVLDGVELGGAAGFTEEVLRDGVQALVY